MGLCDKFPGHPPFFCFSCSVNESSDAGRLRGMISLGDREPSILPIICVVGFHGAGGLRRDPSNAGRMVSSGRQEG
jgi:hypothetical protein